MTENSLFGRRQFLTKSAATLIGSGVVAGGDSSGAQSGSEEATLKVRGYRVFGRTGFRVSDIGGGYIQEEGLIAAMLDAGVNYLDTAESYPGHQRILSRAIKGRDRKSLFITSKLEIQKDLSKEGFLKRARQCLEELQTDYIDCMMMHMPEKVQTLKLEGFHAAMQELKAEGRVRFVGVTHHGSFWFADPEETMENVLLAAADDGRFDVFLMAYNFLRMDGSEHVLNVCKEKQIGVALMKTAPVATYYLLKTRIEQLEKEGKEVDPLYRDGLARYKDKLDKAGEFIEKHGLKNPDEIKEAAIRFVLTNPNVGTVCCSVRNYDEMKRAVLLSGTTLSDGDRANLAAYTEGCGALYCRHACGVCEPLCPHRVPVNAILRYNHYFEAQGREEYAMRQYAAIPGPRADRCSSCPGHCEAACPYGVPVQGRLIVAHRQLSLA